MAEITMPKMGDGMEEGTINTWLKKEGDHVNAGDAIAEVETDKASVEIAAYETGILSKITVQVGETVPVGAVIGMIGGAAAGAGNGQTVPKAATVDRSAQAAAAPDPTRGGGEESDITSLVPSGNGSHGNGHAIGKPDVSHPALGERVKASPLVRAMAREMGLELAHIPGSGPGGRIVQRDVMAYLQTRDEQTLLRPAAAPQTTARPDVVTAPAAAPQTASVQEIATSNMRKAIAKRTVQSKQNTPHFYVTMVIEMDRAMALLKELNADASDGKVTVNDIIVKASARALAKVPEVNATWTPENTIRRYAEAHIGVAVGIDDGLIIPVIRDCQKKTLREISVEAKQLITKARNNQLKPEEYQGSTFSVSNLGMMGVDEFIAIINPPEAAILAIGGISREPVVIGEGNEIVIRSRMKVTISADHRLLDGVVAARFLQEVKKSLEAPFSLLS
jgi:pyruvate dehydrogenase E2 component (dihydrolipoamide acetyltransferase)